MFDKLVDIFLSVIGLFKFWVVMDPFEQGVLLRLGKFKRVIDNGFHWVIPFDIDRIVTEHVVPSTHSLGYESILSKDGKQVTFHAIVTFRIKDIQKALLEVADVDHAVRDACAGEIGRVLRESTWDEILQEDILERLTSACRKRGWRWGVEIMAVQLSGLTIAKNIRLMGNT